MRESRADFGKELARLRTEKGVSLEDLASATKVRAELLRHLENGRLEALPPAVFVEGYLKTCTRHLGADPVPLVARYRALIFTGGEVLVPAPVPSGTPEAVQGSGSWIKWLAAVALLAGVGYAAYYVVARMDRARMETEPQQSAARITKQPEQDANSQVGNPVPNEASSPQPQTSAPSEGLAIPVPAPERPVEPGGPAGEASPGAPAAESQHPATPMESAPAVMPAGDLVLVASGPCWCEIWADGRRALYRQVAAGERVGLQGAKFRVSMGNVGAVELSYKGQRVPLPGEQGKVVKDLEIPAPAEVKAP